MKITILLILAILLTGCVSIQLGDSPAAGNGDVVVADQRPPAAKQEHRENFMLPVIDLGDDSFAQPPTVYLKGSLYRHKPAGMPAVTLEITKFGIIDYFPYRAKIAMTGAIGGVLSSMGYIYIADQHPVDSDAIICALEGKLNGNPITVSSTVPYKISAFAMLVRNQPEFIAAVKTSIDQCVVNAFEKIK